MYENLRIQIQKILHEVFDINQEKVAKSTDTGFEIESYGARTIKTINIQGNIVEIEFLIDAKDGSIQIGFSSGDRDFSKITNSNIVGAIFNNIFYYFFENLQSVNQKLIEKNRTIVINKIVLTPTKTEEEENNNISADKTKRGRLYLFFINKHVNIKRTVSDNTNLTIILNKLIILGKKQNLDLNGIKKS